MFVHGESLNSKYFSAPHMQGSGRCLGLILGGGGGARNCVPVSLGLGSGILSFSLEPLSFFFYIRRGLKTVKNGPRHTTGKPVAGLISSFVIC